MYSTYLKFGNERACVIEPYGERRFFSPFPKIQFSSERDELFFGPANMGSINLFF